VTAWKTLVLRKNQIVALCTQLKQSLLCLFFNTLALIVGFVSLKVVLSGFYFDMKAHYVS
jgi:hypothetical protein